MKTTWSNDDQLSWRCRYLTCQKRFWRAENTPTGLAAGQGLGLFDEVVPFPFGVGPDAFLPIVLGLFCCSSLRLPCNEVGVRREVLHAVAFEVRKSFEFVFVHEGK